MRYNTDKFLANIYGYSFFNSLTLLTPVYAVFMSDHGLSELALSSLLMLWPIGVLLTQIPISSIADKIGIKRTLIIGQLLKMIAFVLWVIWPYYAGFAIGMLLWGMHGAIYHVVSEDVLYAQLNAASHSSKYTRALGRRKNFHTLGALLSSFGSLLLFFGYEWITLASVTALAISAFFVTRMEITVTDETENIKFIHSMLSGVKVVARTPAIFVLLIVSVLVTNLSYLNDYLGLIGVGIGLPREFIGAVPLFMLICQMLGQGFAHKFTKMPGKYLCTLITFAGILFVAFALFYNIWALFAIGMAYIVCGIVKVVIYSRFQDRIPNKYRLEILSFYNLADQFMYMITCLVIGIGSTIGGWRYGVLILGTMLFLCGILMTVFVHNDGMQRLNKYVSRVLVRPDGTSSV